MSIVTRLVLAAAISLCAAVCGSASGSASGLAGGSASGPAGGSASGSASRSANGAASALHHSGRWITDSSGRVVILHGVNKGAKNYPYDLVTGFGPSDMAFLAENGFNVVRLGVEHDGLEPQPGVFNPAYIASIQGVVERLWGYGIRTLIDFHQDEYGPALGGNGIARWATIDDGLPHQPQCGFGCNQLVQPGMNAAFSNFWADAHLPNDPLGLQDHVARAGAALASALRDEPGLLGYEILNEPWPGFTWPTCAVPVGCPLFERLQLDTFYARVDHLVRAADPVHIVFYEPVTTFNQGVSTWAGPLADPNGGFAFHVYCLLGGADMPAERPGGSELCPTLEDRVLDNAITQVDRTHEALLMTEFGATVAPRPVLHITAGADQRMIPWIWWEYTEAFRPNLGILVRTYPRVIAGTPLSWSFDPATKAFDFAYAARPIGTTEIFVPSLQYPHGYALTVHGASVVSNANQLVTLAASSGTVTVRIRAVP